VTVSVRANVASPKESLKRARRDADRRHLIDAAERVFADRGYEGTHVQDVAAEAGLSLASLYALVDGKAELYAEIHATRGRALLERAGAATKPDPAAEGGAPAMETLLRGVRAYVEFLVEHPHYLRLQLLESQPWALRPRFPSSEQQRQWRSGLQLTVEVFRAAIAEGSVVEEDPQTLGRLMIAAHQVYLGEWVEAGMKEPAEALVRRMQLHVRRAFGKGRRG
jgi:AcrR family transcriptional regulator